VRHSATVGGHFSLPVWQAAVHEAQGSEAQNKTESQDSLRHGLKNNQVLENGFLKEAVKLAGKKSCPVLLTDVPVNKTGQQRWLRE